MFYSPLAGERTQICHPTTTNADLSYCHCFGNTRPDRYTKKKMAKQPIKRDAVCVSWYTIVATLAQGQHVIVTRLAQGQPVIVARLAQGQPVIVAMLAHDWCKVGEVVYTLASHIRWFWFDSNLDHLAVYTIAVNEINSRLPSFNAFWLTWRDFRMKIPYSAYFVNAWRLV